MSSAVLIQLKIRSREDGCVVLDVTIEEKSDVESMRRDFDYVTDVDKVLGNVSSAGNNRLTIYVE